MTTSLPPPSVNNTSLNEMVDDRVCAVVTPMELSLVVARVDDLVAGANDAILKGLLEMQPLEGDLIFASPHFSRQISCSRRRCDPDSAVLLTLGQLRIVASAINPAGGMSPTKFACNWPFFGVFRNSIRTGQRYIDGVERSKWNVTVSRKAGIFGAFEYSMSGLPRVADSIYIKYSRDDSTGMLDVTLHTRPLSCANDYIRNRERTDVEVPIGMILHSPAHVPSAERMNNFKKEVCDSHKNGHAPPEMRQFPIVQVELGSAP